ncbi:TetR/AcrR family transcriptional regulator [Gordonia sp. X0973]|uniref:TetR/AcrR family transcriptional regulator n=1 Tax=Gordonia sp. X0973 TaxID=2742602 RepID=UPI000F53ED7A|nr:TetR/AcrR family transcriptional regulator [Gordonia sp. X0973]QKT08312.1 TetR/AcrR family transcriptional regulator [Gordonia sp. X0973]
MTTTTTRRTRAAHLGPERRRPEILDTALRIAVDEGLGSVSIASVAKAMGVTRPVVYSCFSDRVALVSALTDRESAHLLTVVLDSLHSARGDDPEQVFIDGYRALLSAVDSNADAWRLLIGGSPDPETAQTIADYRKVVGDASTRWIAPALAHWWDTKDLERKKPALIELFLSSCEAAMRVLFDPDADLSVDDLAQLYGSMMAAAYRAA